ncbi:arf-GAP with SH3 domain, ANK repeat and PH domain-containing protein 2-like isoform X4 [Oncorhynchus tshawytscha]|uniref:arf-GAP with SH3 domain, ANK repeat and PH domain-containing protein 2-like isoform X4 n=1 Tax=Oncorhynchus tshawytscha TaxID=74940 RepID=UPI001C3C26EE|nr:arf-GAP with SH3 domain, ANK repeat and PH domain-containing protein 2-like isoform X4 [Oncorhynchus tshawytscha]
MECLKLLLRGKASIDIASESGETPLDIAKRLKHLQCEELLNMALAGKFNAHVHVEYEWRLHHEDMDESDEDLDDKVRPSPHRREERPASCYTPGSNSHLQPSPASLARDKQRGGYMPNLVTNETYGAILNASPPAPGGPATTSAPPLPPRNIVQMPGLCGMVQSSRSSGWKPGSIDLGGRQRSSSDPPNMHLPVPPMRVTSTTGLAPPPVAKTVSVMEAMNQQSKPGTGHVHSRAPPPKSSSGNAKSFSKGPTRTGSIERPAKEVPGCPQNSIGQSLPPAPMPRKTYPRPKRVKAIYNCLADNPDELTFTEGEVIVVDGEEDQEWWLGHIEGEPMRRGAFPVTFIHFIMD